MSCTFSWYFHGSDVHWLRVLTYRHACIAMTILQTCVIIRWPQRHLRIFVCICTGRALQASHVAIEGAGSTCLVAWHFASTTEESQLMRMSSVQWFQQRFWSHQNTRRSWLRAAGGTWTRRHCIRALEGDFSGHWGQHSDVLESCRIWAWIAGSRNDEIACFLTMVIVSL